MKADKATSTSNMVFGVYLGRAQSPARPVTCQEPNHF